MNIVTTTSVFPPCYPQKEALLRLKACGFRHLDLAFDYLVQEDDFPFVTDAWEAWVRDLAAFAKANGVCYTHGHGEGTLATRGETVNRTFEACRILGISKLVIHPIFRDEDGNDIADVDQFVSVNEKAVRPLLPLAERCGVTILTENLFWGASIDPLALSSLVEKVNSPYFGWCYDTGHAHSFGMSPDVLIGLKHPPLSLHVQDNHGWGGERHGKDEHLMPGDGTLDWKRFMEVLHEIGYKGELVLEAHHQSLDAPDEERETVLSELYSRAKKLNDYYCSL
jgi:sugar phosphate isomerase/epimerase